MRASRRRWLLGLLASVAPLLGCGQAPSAPAAPHVTRAPATEPPSGVSEHAAPTARTPEQLGPAAPEQTATSPAHAPRGLSELALEGFLPTLLSWPETNRWPQPVLVAAHGAGDSAESQCELWRRLLGERGVVVCLRGRAIRKSSPHHGYYYPDHLTLEREFLAAISALGQHHPDLVDTERMVYAGYSQGAQMGLLMLLRRGALVPHLLLIEGGAGDWTEQRAAQFAKSGGERVALVCGTPGCHGNAERSAARLRARGLAASVRHVPGGGHTYLGAVVPANASAFSELTLGDPRWAAPRD